MPVIDGQAKTESDLPARLFESGPIWKINHGVVVLPRQRESVIDMAPFCAGRENDMKAVEERDGCRLSERQEDISDLAVIWVTG